MAVHQGGFYLATLGTHTDWPRAVAAGGQLPHGPVVIEATGRLRDSGNLWVRIYLQRDQLGAARLEGLRLGLIRAGSTGHSLSVHCALVRCGLRRFGKPGEQPVSGTRRAHTRARRRTRAPGPNG
jgi:hypothetical protein